MPADSPSRVFLARARQRPVNSSTPDDEQGRPALAAADQQTAGRAARGATSPQARTERPTSPPASPASPNVVIDLTDGAVPTRAASPRRSQRGWLVVLAAIVVVAAGLAVFNYQAALRWRTRTIAAEGLAAQANAEAAAQRSAATTAAAETAAAQKRRKAVAEQLAVSEADVASLEARVAALASDRARDQDRGAGVVTASADAQVRAVQAQVDSCTTQVDTARNALRGDGDATSWQRALTAVQASCEQVAADVDALVSSNR